MGSEMCIRDRYYNALENGFIDLNLTAKSATVRMICVSTVTSRNYEAFETARFKLKKSGESIKVKSPRGLNLKQRALFHGLG